ncbi:TM2 domain-containing protein 2 isoform X1 [Fundulus heteroclitus]|uniref:TM2 domain-containing protein 2 isoform X1 n=1 Tax=Fundulus heteroclitus TaxID=8078 RepID=UPI00165CBD26|nr:TM2 domain-containing protein 2 isoform X1 [Fundulus heteroclitus]
MISVSYILLCGQFLLLLAVVFLQCLEGIHSQNSSSAAPTAAPASSPTQGASSAPFTTQPELPKDEGPVDNVTVYEYRPPSPVVLCSYLPEEFIYCQDPVDHAVNHSVLLEMGHGCARWGGQTKEEVNHTQVICTALDGIECAGAREFLRDGVPCINSREPQQKGCRDQRVMEGQPSLLWRFWPRPLPEVVSLICCAPGLLALLLRYQLFSLSALLESEDFVTAAKFLFGDSGSHYSSGQKKINN